jgi:RNA polymerase sigma factor (sigma-70 family)
MTRTEHRHDDRRERDRQRAVLVLRYYADLSEAQIAEIMGISISAVGRHTERASAALRAVLDRAPE